MKINYLKNEMSGRSALEAVLKIRIGIYSFIYGCKRALVWKLGSDTNREGR